MGFILLFAFHPQTDLLIAGKTCKQSADCAEKAEKIFCKYMIPILLLLAAISCDKTTVGYLFADNLTYTPDSIVVKAVLDPVEDEEQIDKEIPWQSVALE